MGKTSIVRGVFVRRKLVKGNAYLCLVKTIREGSRVRQVIVHWIGREPAVA